MDVIPEALSPRLLRRVRRELKRLPPEAWQLEETRPGNQAMCFYRLDSRVQAEWDDLIYQIRAELLTRVPPASANERLMLNVSMYTQGCFLDPHLDLLSEESPLVRNRALVLHLPDRPLQPEDGGRFVACCCDQPASAACHYDESRSDFHAAQSTHYLPVCNQLLTFAVPWAHAVEPVHSSGTIRYAIYGWFVAPRIHLVPSQFELETLLHRVHIAIIFTTPTPELWPLLQPVARPGSPLMLAQLLAVGHTHPTLWADCFAQVPASRRKGPSTTPVYGLAYIGRSGLVCVRPLIDTHPTHVLSCLAALEDAMPSQALEALSFLASIQQLDNT